VPTQFFKIIFNDDDINYRNRIDQYNAGSSSIDYYLNKYNQFFNKLKFPNGRFLRIYVRRNDSPHFILGYAQKAGFITMKFNNYDVESFLLKSNDDKKEALINIMYYASKIIFEKAQVDFSEMEVCFNNLWASDYKVYHKRVSKLYKSPLKTYRFYFWHEIEIDNTNVFWIVENAKTKLTTKHLIYAKRSFGDYCFEYFRYNPIWINEDIFQVSYETGEVVHEFNVNKGTYEVKYYPMPSWSETYLQLKLKNELSKDHIERRQISKEMDIEFKKLQEQVWLRGIR